CVLDHGVGHSEKTLDPLGAEPIMRRIPDCPPGTPSAQEKRMRRTYPLALVIISLMLVWGVGRSWGGPPNNDISDALGNTAGGPNAMFNTTTGSYNTAFGLNALLLNTTGGNNTATGSWALFSTTTGGNNTATGSWALFSTTTGAYNTATGNG